MSRPAGRRELTPSCWEGTPWTSSTPTSASIPPRSLGDDLSAVIGHGNRGFSPASSFEQFLSLFLPPVVPRLDGRVVLVGALVHVEPVGLAPVHALQAQEGPETDLRFGRGQRLQQGGNPHPVAAAQERLAHLDLD